MTTLAKWLRKASSLFAEKTEVKADDFGLEHILLYHGLAGSSPDNQRQFKDVRNDILSAISRKNSQNLCINLKIAPLFWEEKLHRIFDEAKSQSSQSTIDSLLPTVEAGQEAGKFDPLMHEDWRVRANAASVLAFMETSAAEERMIESLHDTARGASPAFCHLARSLATFRSDSVKAALAEHIMHREAWIRVDSVNALARWPLEQIAPILVEAFGEEHDFVDYAAVAVARLHKPAEFLQSEDEEIIDLGAVILLGAMEAAAGTFSINSDLLPEISVHECLTLLLAAASRNPSPERLRALSQLTDWLDKNYHQYRLEFEGYPQPEEIAQAKEELQKLLSQTDARAALEKALSESNARTARRRSVHNAVKLAGELKWKEAVPQLTKFFESAPVYANDVIEALGLIGDPQSAPLLIRSAKSLVNLEVRTQSALSANPINENDPDKAKTYWYILRALGNLPSNEALAFLLEATSDCGPDKREEALSSAIKLGSLDGVKLARTAELKGTLQKCLSDPSSQVRVRAMEGAAILNMPELIVPLVGLINAQEMSVTRGALNALEKLAKNGHKDAVRAALTEARNNQSNAAKVKRIDEFIKHHL